jgi:hypothetical protein
MNERYFTCEAFRAQAPRDRNRRVRERERVRLERERDVAAEVRYFVATYGAYEPQWDAPPGADELLALSPDDAAAVAFDRLQAAQRRLERWASVDPTPPRRLRPSARPAQRARRRSPRRRARCSAVAAAGDGGDGPPSSDPASPARAPRLPTWRCA